MWLSEILCYLSSKSIGQENSDLQVGCVKDDEEGDNGKRIRADSSVNFQ